MLRDLTTYRLAKSVFILTLIFIVFTPVIIRSQLSKDDLGKAISIEKLQHPYLYFTNEEKPLLLERIKTEEQYKNIWNALLAEGHRFVKMPFEKKALIEPEHPRYETDGDEVSYASEIMRGATTLSFLYQMTGNVEYAKRGIEFAIAIVDLPEWVNGAHRFDIIYPRVWPWNVPDDQVCFSFDITSAAKARTLAIVYDWLYPALTLQERDKIRNGLLEKAITRVRGNYEFFWWSQSYRCNWAAVCYSGLGVAAMTLLKESPQLLDVVAECYNRLNLVFDQIGDEGGWQEGRGYYGFMLEHSVYFMDPLKRLSNGKYNLFNHRKIYSHPFDFPLYSLTAAFEDSDGGPVGSSTLVNKFVTETGNNTAAWYRNNILRSRSGNSRDGNIFDIIWPQSKVTPIEPEQKSMLFKNIDWTMMRSNFLDPASVTIAAKAGFNNDPHHGHLDCGQFILTYQNVPFISEPGRMRYDEFYFNEDRYEYPYASSLGHNVVFVNGEEQIIAKKKNQPWKEGIGGKVLDFQTNAKRDYVLMDPTRAYPNSELKKWRRSIILEKPNITVVLDEVGANPGSEIKTRFFPGVGVPTNIEMDQRALTRVLANPNSNLAARIAGGGGEYKLMSNYVLLTDNRKHSMVLIPLVLDGNFKLVEDKIPTMPVTADARLTWFQFIETVTKAKSNLSFIATIILPVGDQKEAETIVKTAKINQISPNQIEVSIDIASGNYKWLYEKSKDGYVLKD